MTETYDLIFKVISQTDNCSVERKVDDYWILDSKIPEGLCLSAFHSLLLGAQILRRRDLFL